MKKFINDQRPTTNDQRPTTGSVPQRLIVVSYVNTSADVKALTDVVVTSSNAKKIVDQLPKYAKIIFGPDYNLGSYINSVTGRNMLLWNGACHVHSRFSLEALLQLKAQNPGVEVLAHPECKAPILAQSDVIGSTKALLEHTIKSPAKRFIIATESGILFEMQRACPDKEFIPVPPEMTEGVGCSCNECEYMRMNTLEKVYNCLLNESPEMQVSKEIADKAVSSINRMLEMS